MHINYYSFGKIVIGGEEYNRDVILFPNKIKEWWRKEGHLVRPEDIEEILKAEPSLLIIGTGAFSMMKNSQEVKKILENKNIKLIEKETEEACNIYNEKAKSEKVIAAFHLTC